MDNFMIMLGVFGTPYSVKCKLQNIVQNILSSNIQSHLE